MENLNNKDNKKGICAKFEIPLMVVSLVIILAMVAGLTIFPEQGMEVAHSIMDLITHTFGAPIQVMALVVFIFLIVLAFSKYGDIRMGSGKPEYKTISWIGMMFFCGNGAGTVYWAFLEWGHHYNAAPMLHGAEISDAFNYEQSLAYCFYDWGPIAWALLCIFVLPFAYHYHVMKDNDLKFSALTKYSLGEKHAKGKVGKFVDFLFIFAAVGSVAITAGVSASTIGSALGSLFGIDNSFLLQVAILLGVAIIYSITSTSGIKKGMQRISDSNIYACTILLLFILLVGPTKQIINSVVNSIGLMGSEFLRMTTFTDPVAQTGYPQDWTVFYLIYWFVFGPFTGLFVAKISKGRKLREIILNMLGAGTAGLICFFGIVGAYQQNLKMEGIMDLPQMLADGSAEDAAMATISTLPFSTIAMIVYVFVIVIFLATTFDAISFTLSSTVSKDLKPNEEPNRWIKLAWCIILCALPIAISFIGTDIDTIKSIVMATGFPLIIILVIIYKGFLGEMFKKFRDKSREDIIRESKAAAETETEE